VKKKATNKAKIAKKLITNVAIILDESGSMGEMKKEAIEGTNKQIEELKKPANKKLGYKVSIVTFNDIVNEPKTWNVPVADIKLLEKGDYAPGGMTALLDAIGKTIKKMETFPGNTGSVKGFNIANLVIILTDGLENASKEYARPKGYETIKAKIETLQAKGNWTFSFLGANMDVMAEACGRLGIPQGNVAVFVANPAGLTIGTAQTICGTQSYSSTRMAGGQSVKNFYNQP